MEIGTRYEPQNIEMKWYKHWLEKKYFTPKGAGPKYSIVILASKHNGKNSHGACT